MLLAAVAAQDVLSTFSTGNTAFVCALLWKWVLIGIGSNVCSKNSRICGLIIVSSGILWRVIQANKLAFLVLDFLNAVTDEGLSKLLSDDTRGDTDSSGSVLDS